MHFGYNCFKVSQNGWGSRWVKVGWDRRSRVTACKLNKLVLQILCASTCGIAQQLNSLASFMDSNSCGTQGMQKNTFVFKSITNASRLALQVLNSTYRVWHCTETDSPLIITGSPSPWWTLHKKGKIPLFAYSFCVRIAINYTETTAYFVRSCRDM